MADIEIVHERPDTELAASLLERYHDELASRFPDGFDLGRTEQISTIELVEPAGACLVVLLGGDPAGCGAVRKLDDARAEIKRMWIEPAARCQGIGRRLLEALEHLARDMNCPLVCLDTNWSLTEALALYSASGYREVPAYNDNPYASYWFEKCLS
ncbi:MAG: acetyltransferase [Acidimicrobiaceae bacterium]|nr:acetyltransferase [Acidimicrobiaceae bacterium]